MTQEKPQIRSSDQGDEFSASDVELINEISEAEERRREYYELSDTGGIGAINKTFKDSQEPEFKEQGRQPDLDHDKSEVLETPVSSSPGGRDRNSLDDQQTEDEEHISLDGFAVEDEDSGDFLLPEDEFVFQDIETPDYDLDSLEDDSLDEYDDNYVRDDLVADVETHGVLDKTERSYQIAVEVAQVYDWGHDGIRILTEIFSSTRGNRTRQSIEEAIQSGCTMQEIFIAYGLRVIWAGRPEFWINLAGYSYFTLSWPVALRVVRLFRSYPDLSELEGFLDELFDDWWVNRQLTKQYPSFFYYLKSRLMTDMHYCFATPLLCLGDGFLEDDMDYDAGRFRGFNTPLMRDFEFYNLISSDVSDKINEDISIMTLHSEIIENDKSRNG